jgi:hypothetical protein
MPNIVPDSDHTKLQVNHKGREAAEDRGDHGSEPVEDEGRFGYKQPV